VGGWQLLLVPYSGGPTHALNDVLGGRIPVIIEAFSGLLGAVQAGKLKPIAAGSLQRLPDFPELPTVSETLPGFNAVGWQALVAPNGTPQAIVRKIGTDLREVLAQPEVRRQLAARGGYPRPMSPDEVVAFVADQQRTWNPLLQQFASQAK
jgi:tripartite-type tricarboxylate transporter receptor subunit TctC